jgi:hypothetical protein
MSALELGQINFRPATEYVLYHNNTDKPLNVTIALADIQTPFTLKCDTKEETVSMSGAITMAVPAWAVITVSHGDATVMQPAKVSLSVG